MYRDSLIMLALASDEVTAAVVKAAANYFLYSTEPEELDGLALQVWQEVKHSIDTGTANYKKRCEENRKRINDYWQKKNTAGIPPEYQRNTTGIPPEYHRNTTGIPILNPESLITNPEPKNPESNSDIVAPKPRRERFAPPTEAIAAGYFEQQGGTAAEAQAFVDFYASKGWKVGAAPMKDWQAAARGWIRRNKDPAQPKAAAKLKESSFLDFARELDGQQAGPPGMICADWRELG